MYSDENALAIADLRPLSSSSSQSSSSSSSVSMTTEAACYLHSGVAAVEAAAAVS